MLSGRRSKHLPASSRFTSRMRKRAPRQKTMERWLGSLILAMIVAASSFAAGPRPQAVKFDQTVSIDVENITLGRLLQLWDQATGMQSSVPRELSTRTVSISFSGLNVNDAVQKIFEKLPLD